MVTVAVLASACRQPSTVSTFSEIAADPQGLDFGNVTMGTQLTLAFTLRSSGIDRIHVDSVEVVGANAEVFTVDLSAPIDLTDQLEAHVTYAPTALGLNVAQVTVRSDAQNAQRLDISLRGLSVLDAGVDAGTTGGTDAGTKVMQHDAGYYADDSGCPPTWSSGTEATTYQVNAAHTGAQPDDRLTLPLCERWRRELGGVPSYSVVSNGLVYVATAGANGRQLWALDQYSGATQWGPKSLSGTYSWLAVALGDGQVYALSDNGVLVAFDAATGMQHWLAQTGDTSAPPTAANGSIFVSAHLALQAFLASSGTKRWSANVINGDTSSPAVSGGAVFASYACNQAYGFSNSGTQYWHATSSCSGGGGKTTAVNNGKVYTRDLMGDLVLATTNGKLLGSYTSTFVPAFGNDVFIQTNSGSTQATSLTTDQQVWSANEVAIAAPLVVGANVVVATNKGVVVLDLKTGAPVSSVALSGVRGTDEQNVSAPFAGLSAANGMLFVPVGTSVVAY